MFPECGSGGGSKEGGEGEGHKMFSPSPSYFSDFVRANPVGLDIPVFVQRLDRYAFVGFKIEDLVSFSRAHAAAHRPLVSCSNIDRVEPILEACKDALKSYRWMHLDSFLKIQQILHRLAQPPRVYPEPDDAVTPSTPSMFSAFTSLFAPAPPSSPVQTPPTRPPSPVLTPLERSERLVVYNPDLRFPLKRSAPEPPSPPKPQRARRVLPSRHVRYQRVLKGRATVRAKWEAMEKERLSKRAGRLDRKAQKENRRQARLEEKALAARFAAKQK